MKENTKEKCKHMRKEHFILRWNEKQVGRLFFITSSSTSKIGKITITKQKCLRSSFCKTQSAVSMTEQIYLPLFLWFFSASITFKFFSIYVVPSLSGCINYSYISIFLICKKRRQVMFFSLVTFPWELTVLNFLPSLYSINFAL